MTTIREALAAGLEHHRANRFAEAEHIYRQILDVEPQQPDALHLLGLIAHRAGQHDAAIEYMESAIRISGSDPAYHNNLAEVYRTVRRLPEAVAHYRRALELKPDYAKAHNNLAITLRDLGDLAEAAASCQRAVQIDPLLPEAHNNFGIVLGDLGKADAAIAEFHQALQLKPHYAEAWNNLGNAMKDTGRIEKALGCFERAMELDPQDACSHSNLVYASSFHARLTGHDILERARGWDQRHAEPLERLIQPHRNDHGSERRLRIGYVSPDFRDHCLAFSLVPLFSSHDHRNFEIFCFSDVASPDRTTAWLRSQADVWREIAGRTDDRVAELIRQDRIDILVDATMHMDRNRLLLFARKPAPVQVCWLAYPGTTGLSAMDHRLTDPHLDPPGFQDDHYAEQSVRLPDSFWCYYEREDDPAVSALPAMERNYVTFGCLNNFCKINASALGLWIRVLSAVERSRLVLLAPEGQHREAVIRRFAEARIDRDRIRFLARQSRPKYLGFFRDIDISLDTVPYNGHMTSLDSLWMGVPVVTLVGETVVGRAGLSQLTNLGLTEFIARTPDEFVEIAVRWARDPDRLSELRASLRERMRNSVLMDGTRFTRGVEEAYRRMWQQWCAGRGAAEK